MVRLSFERARGRFEPHLLVLAAALAFAGDVRADTPTPIQITALGPGPVQVRLAHGGTFPCDSGDNRRIVEAKLTPGQTLRASTPDRCVCFQQTFAPFTDIDWSASALVCRPQVCTRFGKGQKCVPAADPTIRLQVSSKRR